NHFMEQFLIEREAGRSSGPILRRRFEIILNRRYTQALGFEQTFQMFARIDDSARSQHALRVDQRRKRQPADLIGNAEWSGNDVRKTTEAVGLYELALACRFAVAGKNDVQPIPFR